MLVLPQRHPLEVAKAAATLADLSDGRFILGVGAGWSRREMRALGWDPTTRGARLDDHLDVLDAAWNRASDLAGLTLRHYQIPPDVILQPVPRPDQTPAVLIGGTSRAALARVRRRGDGWLATAGTGQLARVGQQLAAVRAAADRHLYAVVKISLPSPDPQQAIHLVNLAAHDGWDEISFELGTWNLDDVCVLVEDCANHLAETTRG